MELPNEILSSTVPRPVYQVWEGWHLPFGRTVRASALERYFYNLGKAFTVTSIVPAGRHPNTTATKRSYRLEPVRS